MFAHPFVAVGLKKVIPAVMLNSLMFLGAYKYTGNTAVVDVAWEAGQWVVGSVYAYHFNSLSTTAGKVMFGLLTLWAIRLGGFILLNRVMTG